MMQRRSLLFSVLAISAVTFGLGFLVAKNTPPAPSYNNGQASSVGTKSGSVKIRDLDDVWDVLQESYYDSSKLEAEKLEYGAVKGFVAGIGDPYTVFMTPEESKEFATSLEGQLEGIGAELEVKEGKLVVVTPLKNSPASEAGIRPGDIIYKVNGELTEEMTLAQAIKKIRGEKGTKVTLTIIRETAAEPFDVTITRREVTIDSVTLEEPQPGIFHISINQFNDHTTKEFRAAVEKILLAKAKGIVLDVRGNGGGYLDVSVEVLSELIEGQKVAVIIKKKDPKDNEEVKTNGSGRLKDIPLVVLVNKGSASASEIVAGAVQDYKRGILIGEKTFGKGSVQEIVKLKDGSNLRVTIAHWFTPLSRSIEEVGIPPDTLVVLTEEDSKAKRDPQLNEAVNYLKRL